MAAALLASLGFVAAVLAWRRLARALDDSLEVPALVAVALIVSGTAAGVRLLWRSSTSDLRRGAWLDRWMTWAPAAAVTATAAALSLPRTSSLGLASLWGIVVVEEAWSLGTGLRRLRPARWPPAAPRPERTAPPATTQLRYDLPQPSPPQPISIAVGPPSAGQEIPPDDVVQQLTRSHAADGSEILSGWLRVEMTAAQRSASLHVAFCPPFAQTPQVAVEQLGGPPARIRTVQLLPYGTRFDLKLDQPAGSSCGVLLRFVARSSRPAGSAPEPGEEPGEE
jgi:hypothetical protein